MCGGVANRVTQVASTYKFSFTTSSRTHLHSDRQQGPSAKQRGSPHTHGTNPSQCQSATSIHRGGGGGVTANSRTPACNRLGDDFFFPLSPLFSKNFCMSCAVGILVAAEVELLERVAGPVCASSGVVTGSLGLFTPRVFRRTSPLTMWPLEHEQTGRHWETAWLRGRPWTVTPFSLEY